MIRHRGESPGSLERRFMLPGLRFLIAAILVCTSALVFGMGAIALMRASHQQFASAPPRLPPEPVFAQAPQTAPATLSMLRIEPAPPAPPLGEIVPPERLAALSTAERIAEPSAAPVAESGESRDDVVPAEEMPKPDSSPVAQTPEMPADEPATADATQQVAAAPTIPEPAITGSIAEKPADTLAPEDKTPSAAPIVDPPLPERRPQVAALPAPTEAIKKPAAKPAVKRKVRQVKRATPKKERLPTVTSAPTLSSIFGGNN